MAQERMELNYFYVYILQNSALLSEDMLLLNIGGRELEQVLTVSHTINNINFFIKT